MMESAMDFVIQREDPYSLDAQMLMDELSAMLALLSGDGGQSRFCTDDVCSARGAFMIARTSHGTLLGCGAFRRFDFGVAELKRIYARSNKAGVGRAILSALETEVVAAGYHTVVLETRAVNRRAIAFYERNGYSPIDGFRSGSDLADARCFARTLCGIDA
ncbi:GNAT family N-acetyltransferase [Paraburkholderia phymatum]|uniref:GNAT family N-acetyltransferase n=1 Tax=Paraburkholderia phymatum TaxID=148447 RepID=A0ACC6UAD6_9BURK